LNNSWYHCATSRTVSGSIPGGVTGDFFRLSFRQNHVPWGRLSLWKWVPGISPRVKAAAAYGWWPTTLVVPNVEMIRGLNLPGTPWATSAFRGTPLPFYIPGMVEIFPFYTTPRTTLKSHAAHVSLVLRLFVLTPLPNIHHFLFYALSISV